MAIPRRRTLLVEMALEQAQANYVRQVLGDSAKAIEEKLSKIGTSGNPLTRMQLEAQRAAIKSMLDQDFSNIQESIANGKVSAAKAASGVVSQYENQLLKAVMSQTAMNRVARSEAQRTVNNLEAAIKRMSGTSYKTLSQQVYKTKQLSAGWVDDIINKGLTSGWSAQQLAKAIVPSISPNVPGGVSYAANRLARTEINNAFHAASWDRYLRSPIVEEVEWLLSSSHPEDDVCNDYATESPFKKNAVPAKPHPNCYCYIVPRLPTEEEFLNRLFSGEYGDEPWAADVADDPKSALDLSRFKNSSASSLPRSKALDDEDGSVSIETYTSGNYNVINSWLRTGDIVPSLSPFDPLEELDDIEAVVRNLDWATRSETSQDLILHRAVDNLDFMGKGDRVGKTFSDKGFVSTSYGDKAVYEGGSNFEMRIYAPKGTKGSLLDNDEEQEFLLARGSKFTVIGETKQGPKTILDVVVTQ